MGDGSANQGRVRALALVTGGLACLALFGPATAQSRDRDRDGLSDRYELKQSHTGVRRADTDRDGLRDGYEVRKSKTNPRRADTDRDGLKDGYELRRVKTHPRKLDTDRDGMNDGLELLLGRNPRKPDLLGGPINPGPTAPGAAAEIELGLRPPDPPLPLPDLLPPDTTITTGPSGTVASGTASFSFASSEAGSTFECQLDRAKWKSCAPPKTYSGLANRSHTFTVRAIDHAGNADLTPASRTWSTAAVPPADTTAPDTSITAGPSGTVTTPSVSFTFASTEPGATFVCRLDGGAWASCTSPKSYSSLADGSHTFDVRATDAAGNVDASPASRTWVVEVTAPDPGPGTNNCMADPSACGFPDVETTGVLPDVARQTVNGSVTLSTAGQVYENKTVNGTISVTAADVKIRNVELVMPRGASYGIQAFGWNTGVSNLVVEDSEIDLNGNYNSKGIAFDRFTLRRVFMHNGSDCAHTEHSVVIEDSLCVLGPDTNSDGWPDNQSWCDGPEHRDGFQSDGGDGLTFRHNTIRNNCGETSAILMSTNTLPIRNVTIVDNLLAGGGYTLYCNAGPDVPNETITGNRFSKVFHPRGGYWGSLTGCGQADVYSGNVWDDTGSALAVG